ncbi:MAG: hypothetical protein ACRD04_06840 [Terriglobales bacterium]
MSQPDSPDPAELLQRADCALARCLQVLLEKELDARISTSALPTLMLVRRDLAALVGPARSSYPELRRESIEEWNARHAGYQKREGSKP